MQTAQTTVGEIGLDLVVNDKQFNSQLNHIQKLAKKAGVALAAAFSVKAITGLVKKATAAGASLNAMNAIVDAALPNMTAKVDQFAKSAGSAFGLSETQAKGFVGKYASMASALGLTEKAAYGMSTTLAGLAGDVASYYHISQDDAFVKLMSVFTGETETLKSLGVVMSQAALDAFALQQGFGKTTQQMSESEKTMLRYQFILDRLKLAAGDFSKYATTWSGSIATMKLNWSNFMATVGQGLINILLPLLQVIARVSNALTALGSRFLAWTEKVTGKAKGVKDAITGALGRDTQKTANNAAASIGNVGSGLNSTKTNAGKAKKAVQALKRELLGFDQITKLTKQDASTGTTGSSGVGGGIDAGGIDFGTAEEQATGFKDKINDIFSKIQIPEPLQNALTHLKTAFGDLFGIVSDAGAWCYDHVLEPLGKWTLNEFAPAAVETLASGIDLLNAALKLLGTIFEPLWEPLIKPFFKFIGDVAIAHIKALGAGFELLAGYLTKVGEGIEALKSTWEKFKTAANSKAVEFKAKVATKWDDIKDDWAALTSNVKGKMVSMKAKVGNKWDDIKEDWGKLTANVKNRTASMKAKVATSWDDLKNKWSKLMSHFKNKTVSISLKFSAAASDIKGWINRNVIDKINGKLSGIPILRNHKIPKLAQGGWVGPNTPQLAMIGDNRHHAEIVAPDDKLAAMARQAAQEARGSSDSQVLAILNAILQTIRELDTDVILDGESIKKNVVKRLNQHTRTTGQPELIF